MKPGVKISFKSLLYTRGNISRIEFQTRGEPSCAMAARLPIVSWLPIIMIFFSLRAVLLIKGFATKGLTNMSQAHALRTPRALAAYIQPVHILYWGELEGASRRCKRFAVKSHRMYACVWMIL